MTLLKVWVEPLYFVETTLGCSLCAARPEKVMGDMLEPHIKFVKHSLRDCPTLRTRYILAAGKNIATAKALKILVENELRDKGLSPKIEEQEYIGRYRGKPTMKLYTCRITLLQQ
jgi:hypothetical protein